MAILLLNEYRTIIKQETVGLSAIHLSIKRLIPAITKVRKIKQGRKDASCPWAKACLG
jgi:hypothetical protein